MDAKGKSILGWIIPIVAIVFLCMKDTEKEAKKHTATAVTLLIAYMAISVICSFLPFSASILLKIAGGLYLVCVILGIVAASKGEEPKIPGLTDLTKIMFKKIFEE